MTKLSQIKRNVRRQSGCLRRLYKELRREWKDNTERYTQLNAEFQRIARREKKAFLSEQCKEIEENNEWVRLEISSPKLVTSRENFMQGWAQ